MKRKIWSLLLAAALLMTVLPVPALAIEAMDAPLTVNGVAVTKKNAEDILGDGTVSFKDDILTLNNAHLTVASAVPVAQEVCSDDGSPEARGVIACQPYAMRQLVIALKGSSTPSRRQPVRRPASFWALPQREPRWPLPATAIWTSPWRAA